MSVLHRYIVEGTESSDVERVLRRMMDTAGRPVRRGELERDLTRYPIFREMPPARQAELRHLYESLRQFGMAFEIEPPYGPHQRWGFRLEFAGIIRQGFAPHDDFLLRNDNEFEYFLDMVTREASFLFMSAVVMNRRVERPRIGERSFLDDFPIRRNTNRRVRREEEFRRVVPLMANMRIDADAARSAMGKLSDAARAMAPSGPTTEQLEADYRV